MEAFGIALYGVLGLAAAPLFCYALVKFVRPFPQLSRFVWWCSVLMLVLLLAELAVLASIGITGGRRVAGVFFLPMISASATAAAPALVCALLTGRRDPGKWWPAIAMLGWIVGVAAIFYQQRVVDALASHLE